MLSSDKLFFQYLHDFADPLHVSVPVTDGTPNGVAPKKNFSTHEKREKARGGVNSDIKAPPLKKPLFYADSFASLSSFLVSLQHQFVFV